MFYYVLLTASLLVFLALCAALWRVTRSIPFLFGMAALYFWSHLGAWSIVTDRLGGDSQMHYHYLFDKIFPVYLDDCYTWTLVLYLLFIVVVATTVLLSVRVSALPTERLQPIVISHDRVILFGGIAALVSYWIMVASLERAFELGKSAYFVTRLETENLGLFRIHQILNRVALIPTSVGLATLLTTGRCRFLAGTRRSRHFVGYAVVLGGMFCFCLVLGNKNELAFALFCGCLFYLVNSTRPRTWQLATCGAVLLACVGLIDLVRGSSMDEIATKVSVVELANSFTRIASSNEAFAAHISLYGAMIYDVPLTYGSSIYCFAASVVPRIFWPTRPDDIYYYYATNVGATAIAEGQGYTIHHATGWYLNFGIPGLVLGGVLLGRIWSALYNNLFRAARPAAATWWRIFCAVGFFTFTASIPSIVRAGPEIYKSVLVESFFVPVVVLLAARSGRRATAPIAAILPPHLQRTEPGTRRKTAPLWSRQKLSEGS
jgi:hypothetical protein